MDKAELIATLLQEQIANIGYPVGCGVAPHPDTLKEMAERVLQIADGASGNRTTGDTTTPAAEE